MKISFEVSYVVALIIALSSFTIFIKHKPTLYIIGDSTVRNSNKEQWGWGTLIADYFDSSKITGNNKAMAGRSSRSYTNEGRWKEVEEMLKPGDFVMIQFGHNDGSYPDTSAKNRGTLKGTGNETVELVFSNGKKEIVHTYGWYIRQFVKSTKAKGATPIVLSMIPRNQWADDKVKRADESFGKWAREVAEQEGTYFIDLNKITGNKYDSWGPDKVKQYFPGDHTHTNKEGANINAQSVVEGIKMLKKCKLNDYLKKSNL